MRLVLFVRVRQLIRRLRGLASNVVLGGRDDKNTLLKEHTVNGEKDTDRFQSFTKCLLFFTQ